MLVHVVGRRRIGSGDLAVLPDDVRAVPVAATFAPESAVRRPAGSISRAATALLLALSGRAAVAAQTDVSISMSAAGTAPHISSPGVVASTPGSPFLYTIAATGSPPLAFAATGLPAGLSLDAASGTISGTTPAAGSYPVSVTVTNAGGSATAGVTLVAGPTLALTPPMGWNSYDSYGSSVKESEALSAAQAVKSQLQPYGWDSVVVDYLWFDPEQLIDSNGRFLPSPSKFPSATGTLGFKPLADKVHALGLKFGIHIMRGVPRKSVSASSPIAGSTYTAAQAGNTSDACSWDSHMWGVHGDTAAGQAWYASIFAQYADWGIDFVKVDDMMNPYVSPPAYHQAETDAIRAAIDKTGRSIVLSLSPGPMQTRDAANLNTDANMWRMVNDFWDTNGLSSLTDEFTAAGNWQGTAGLTAGHWPDADMLPLGYIGPRCPVHSSGPSGLSHNQQVTVMSLWSILPSPLIFGGNPTQLSGDAWTLALLTNDEVLAVDQDAAGTHAKRVLQQGKTEVWARDLAGGRKAVALFNHDTQDAVVSVSFAQLGVSGTPAVRDLWHRADVTGMTTGLSATVPHEAALLYTLSPASGAGGAGGGAAGGAATGGHAAGGRGGVPGSGGIAGNGSGGRGGDGASTGGSGGHVDVGTGGSGGGTGAGGATMGAGSGGTPATGGTGTSATGGNPPGDTGSGGGCSCAVAAPPVVPGVALLPLLVLLRRRRREMKRQDTRTP
jgi:alpha-galactosidase